ncbi:bifunctional phosphopantothenoylcysteine decarboxylase/phosphopantothenate--cysteine ligase CoaBC [Corynebacterium halotolerans]|uniref:Coenzyme A biosynthesis bifunctional protein CoaBC n=1 Tax=Corynebacterium halotolerans YIM 70093 = DSM 44683 TaxID=1121362 RepID=M1NYI8_9CORY|nr:bifunctional phosphopantothenoylcysteine decarboxylase/phosphopantothenate--cysteine ligase CoaBC [Corynebacterium halotolerans]AGF72560.1 phosphopantothenate cysteine ligase / 4'-phospho- pantothenoyl-cysteine decarboxylase [Corynebacterium halotolerans YIM 70093 = DSM 44683]
MTAQQPRRIVVGVAGGIAAYKACHLIRDLKENGDDVRVVPTPGALNFVGAATFEALSGHPVSTTVFDAVDEVQHVRVGQEADAVVIAPATADVIARLVAGRADDLLTATVLVATCPVVVVPAMHTEMWHNPATQDNVATLRRRGIIVMEPAHGRLTGKDTGPGRLPEPGQIAEVVRTALDGHALTHDWTGRKVLITAGGTQENLDPVRYLGNRSSGRQGFALAEIAAHRGAEVTIVAGNTDALPTPSGAEVVPVVSTAEMAQAVGERAADSDVIIMAAAVADFRPATAAGAKMKKGSDDDALTRLDLVENPDILATTVQRRRDGDIPAGTTIVGFAAETGDADHSALDFARAKLRRKGCDLLMCNEVGEGKVFGQTRNRGWLLDAAGPVTEIADGSKHSVAAQILAAVDRHRS